MAGAREEPVAALPLDRLGPAAGAEALARTRGRADALRRRLGGRAIWHVNSTAAGGGVAEMLPSLIGYARGLGLDARWLVIGGEPPFFGVTKRLHHALHGSAGDGGPLAAAERRVYEETAAGNAGGLLARIGPRDVVVLHDPQTAGLAPHLARALPDAAVIWRSHIGSDAANAETGRGWAFLEPYLETAAAFVFTREAYAPPFAAGRPTAVVPPSIDPLTPKNEEIGAETARAVLARAGLIAGEERGPVAFAGAGGEERRVERRAEVVRAGAAPAPDAPLVVQVSRWDPLKDPAGVMRCFAPIAEAGAAGAELVLAGPETSGVADDPEAARVLEETVRAWRALSAPARDRVHLASLPTADPAENAVVVNALQRHAAVIVQKSLQEGFGLTVTEAMWKGRPVLASAVGGIRDQIEDGRSGVLLGDPADLAACGASLRALLGDPARGEAIGRAARERVRERFLVTRHLDQYADLIGRIAA